jgi:hypothetical protein
VNLEGVWLDEAWLFSTIKPLKCKVYIFHYVPLLCPLSTKREVNVVSNVPHSSLRNLYARFGQALRAQCPGWKITMLCNSAQLLRATGFKFDPGIPTRNGGLKVRLMRGRIE